MPRKKIVANPVDLVVDYFAQAQLDAADVVLAMASRIVANRKAIETTCAGVSGRSAAASAPASVHDATPKTRKHRMSADSRRPASEATPIVPTQATVGDDDSNQNDAE